MPTRRRPAGPTAGRAIPAYEGVGRAGSAAAARVSDDLRRSEHRYRAHDTPWVPLAAAKKAADAVGGVYPQREICSWCAVAALAQVATLPLALPEARAARRSLRAGR